MTPARKEASYPASPAALTAAARRRARPINLYGTNPNFGTAEDLKRLVSTAGSQGPRRPQAPHMHAVVACLHSMIICGAFCMSRTCKDIPLGKLHHW